MKGLDTNVLLRYLVRDDEAQTAIADAFLDAECRPECPCVVNRIVLLEIVWVLGRSYKYGRHEIASAMELLLRSDGLHVEHEEAVWVALNAYRNDRADFADRLIAETNIDFGCTETATFDRAAARHSHFRYIGDKK